MFEPHINTLLLPLSLSRSGLYRSELFIILTICLNEMHFSSWKCIHCLSVCFCFWFFSKRWRRCINFARNVSLFSIFVHTYMFANWLLAKLCLCKCVRSYFWHYFVIASFVLSIFVCCGMPISSTKRYYKCIYNIVYVYISLKCLKM